MNFVSRRPGGPVTLTSNPLPPVPAKLVRPHPISKSFEPFEAYMRFVGEKCFACFPWVKPELIKFPRLDLLQEQATIQATLGKGVSLTVTAKLSDPLMATLDDPLRFLDHVDFEVVVTTGTGKTLFSEELDPKEPSDLEGALACVRGLYDVCPSNGVTQYFPLGWYDANNSMFKGQIHLKGRSVATLERVSGMCGPHRFDLPAEQLWGWYDEGTISPVEVVPAEVVATKCLDLTLLDSSVAMRWRFEPGEIMDFSPPYWGTFKGKVNARCDPKELVGFLRDRSLTFTHESPVE